MGERKKPVIEGRLQRWRLVLGADQEEEESQGGQGLSAQAQAIDESLAMLYDDEQDGGLGDPNPDIARWLDDIRSYFPESVVRIMQQDALDTLGMRKIMRHPELLEAIEPDVKLVANILSLSRLMPSQTKETAKQVVREVVAKLTAQLAPQLEQAVKGSTYRPVRNRRPKPKDINWGLTIRQNLKHYQPTYQTIIPEQLVGHGHRKQSLKDVILCVDQSGSMASSVVYASILAAVMASLPALDTKLVAFSTSVVDLSDQLADPVELLFGTQLRGGTDISKALGYCKQLVKRPDDTVLVLISDLYDGHKEGLTVEQARLLVEMGVQFITLLALNDKGRPRYNQKIAGQFAELGIPSFACTPEKFPELMSAVLRGQDISDGPRAMSKSR